MKTFIFSIFLICFLGCDSVSDILIFPVSKDKQLGAQVNQEILKDSKKYPVLSEKDYPKAYGHIRRILNTILKSSAVKYKDDFAYDQIKIIHDDNTLNAFATPGGYIFVYTGLIKYLDSEDHLAGVLGHEIAHAERRHSVKSLQTSLGVQFLLDVILGEKQGLATQALSKLTSLKFSRDNETEADNYSVEYISATSTYQCNGAAGFFEKLSASGSGSSPEFLSTHPSPDNRVSNINNKAKTLKCETTPKNPSSYNDFKSSLPK